MRFYRDDTGLFHRTQAEAKASGHPFEPVDVPVDHHGLTGFLNGLVSAAKPAAPAAAVPAPGEPYQNGMPTRPFMGSRDPAAPSTCPTCGRSTPFA